MALGPGWGCPYVPAMNKALPGRRATGRGKNSSGSDFGIELLADADITRGAGKTRTLVFGSATLKGVARVSAKVAVLPSDPEANTRIATLLTTPGVDLGLPADIPIFVANPANPDHVIRILDGQRVSGFFEGGVFKVAE